MMDKTIKGGAIFTATSVPETEYLPNQGVFLAAMLGKHRGDGVGLYRGRIEPGCGIAREIHPETSETIYVLEGDAVGTVGDVEIPLAAGQVLHVERNVHHG